MPNRIIIMFVGLLVCLPTVSAGPSAVEERPRSVETALTRFMRSYDSARTDYLKKLARAEQSLGRVYSDSVRSAQRSEDPVAVEMLMKELPDVLEFGHSGLNQTDPKHVSRVGDAVDRFVRETKAAEKRHLQQIDRGLGTLKRVYQTAIERAEVRGDQDQVAFLTEDLASIEKALPRPSPEGVVFRPEQRTLGGLYRAFFRSTEPVRRSFRGLHGYIGSHSKSTPDTHRYGAGFYAAVWSLIETPIRNFQIGLPSTWVTPENRDNVDVPLCPEGTMARNWPERGPTFGSVFQTVEGGLGYWAGNRFHYGPPKFSMNATPNCYDTEVASPGWPFFHSSEPLPDDMLGIAQLSNRLLVPPDGLPFSGNPMGELLGYAWMALPLTPARPDPQPTGEQAWTLFVNASNFKGPIAYYLPETWSRISHDYPFDHGRGLDARPSSGGLAGSMEINTVPELAAVDHEGVSYTKIPQLQFPVDDQGRTVLVRDVVLYSRDAIYNDILAWREGGSMPDGVFSAAGMIRPEIGTGDVTYRQDELPIQGINELARPMVFEDNVFGLQWSKPQKGGVGRFPKYFVGDGESRVAIDATQVPPETLLLETEFPPPGDAPGPYSAEPLDGAWATPGPVAGPFQVALLDGSMVTYAWYRFIDQPVFQQYDWTPQEQASLQAMVESMHRHWPIDRDYLPPSGGGSLASFDPALVVSPPKGLEHGHVPIVIRQELAP
jgi:hypothetical protein